MLHEKSVELLNKALSEELTAIHQYMYFHFHADDQGFDPLSALFRRIAMEEMIHAELLAERILFIKGEIEMVLASPIVKINTPMEMLDKARELEVSALRLYNEFANQCGANADSASKRLFEDLVVQEEGHYDQFDVQSENLKKYGEQFLALQSIERSKTLATALPAGQAP
jgi:bacterioferritin